MARKQLSKVMLFHWRVEEAQELCAILRAAGYEPLLHSRDQGASVVRIRESGAVAVVIDLSRAPSHGRDVGMWLRASKSTRYLPLVFAGGESEKIDKVKLALPDAAYSSVKTVGAALKKAIAKPVLDPVVPRRGIEAPPGRTTAQKLGIRESDVVGLIDPPANYESVVGPLPANASLEENPHGGSALTLWFTYDPGVCEAALPGRAKLAARSKLWILWRKGRSDGLNGNFLRERALRLGLVDYKICSLDAVWSGMAFALKKAR